MLVTIRVFEDATEFPLDAPELLFLNAGNEEGGALNPVLELPDIQCLFSNILPLSAPRFDPAGTSVVCHLCIPP